MMPKVEISEELYEELQAKYNDVSGRVNEIVKVYLSSSDDYEIPDSIDESDYRMYFEHGNAD